MATDWIYISAGDMHACAIKNNATLWCWGDDTAGALGNGGSLGNQTSPMQEITGAMDWSVVDAGYNHSCAVKSSGTLWCWGTDSNGKLGNGATTSNQQSPVQESTLATDWVSVDSRYNTSCAVKNNGALWCWGSDSYGQLANGAASANQVSPIPVHTSLQVPQGKISTGADHICFISSVGTLFCAGRNDSGQLAYINATSTPLMNNLCGIINDREYVGGMMIYNGDHDVLQYCDGVGWVGMGGGL